MPVATKREVARPMCVRMAPAVRRVLERLTAKMTLKTEKLWTMTEVIETALLQLAEREGAR